MSNETTNFVVALSVSTLNAYMMYIVYWRYVECMC
jgi:hypothetical protein